MRRLLQKTKNKVPITERPRAFCSPLQQPGPKKFKLFKIELIYKAKKFNLSKIELIYKAKKFKLSKIELIYKAKKFKLSKIELIYKAKKLKVPPSTI